MSGTFVARNRRHVSFDIESIRAPVFCEICFAAGHDLNSCNPFSRVLSTSVESAAHIVSLIEVTIVDFNDIWNDDQLKKSGESVGAKVAAEGLHDPNELRHFQERGR
jgi:hypothetical protein